MIMNIIKTKFNPGGIRTHGLPLRRRTRYPLRYRASIYTIHIRLSQNTYKDFFSFIK